MATGRDISIAARITLFAAAVAVVLSTLLAVTVMIAFHRYATGSLIEEITAAGGRVASQVERDEVDTPMVQHRDRNMQIVDPNGAIIDATPQLQGKPVMAPFTTDHRKITTSVVCGGVFPAGECNIVVAQSAHRDGQDWTIYSSSPTIPWYVAPSLAALVGGAALLLAVATTYLGHRIVAASLRPVNDIRAELDKINESSPERRVPFPPSQDEIHDLADSVNRTLSRLQAAMTQQRQFTSDASHELRSPIAAIRAEIEDALQAPQETSLRQVGTTVLASLNRLESIVGDLLTIARQDDGGSAGNELIDLAELVAAECDRRPPVGKNIERLLEPGVLVVGNRARLARLLANLIDNAERHAAGTVTVRVSRTPSPRRDVRRFPNGIARLEVIDDGPGIDPDKRELVFQRFARLDTARDRIAGGTGLGLPIARQIAEAHQGTLEIEDYPHGTLIALRLPAAAPA